MCDLEQFSQIQSHMLHFQFSRSELREEFQSNLQSLNDNGQWCIIRSASAVQQPVNQLHQGIRVRYVFSDTMYPRTL